MVKIDVHNVDNLPLIDYRELQNLQGDLKTLPDRNAEKLLKSFTDEGFLYPFFVWFDSEGIAWIMDGHGRHETFYLYDIRNQDGDYFFPYVTIPARNRSHAKKLLLSLTSQMNKLSEQGLLGFLEDMDIPYEEIQGTSSFDALDIDGFNPLSGDGSGEGEGEEEGDGEIVKPRVAKSKAGDLYELRCLHKKLVHHVHCADSTDVDVVEKTLAGNPIDLILTDPPYGVAYVGKTKEALVIKNDAMTEEETKDLWVATIDAIWSFWKEGASIYASVPAGPLNIMFAGVLHERKVLRQQLVWAKDSMVLGRSDFHYKHEPILYGWKPGAAHYFIDDRTKTTILEFDRPRPPGNTLP